VLAVEIALIPPRGVLASTAQAEAARDALWAHATSDYEIAHITTTSRQQHIDVTFFVRSDSVSPEAVLAIAQKLVSISPAFESWTVRTNHFNPR
jgi:hypothetical protein